MARSILMACLMVAAVAAVPVVGAQSGAMVIPDNLKVPSGNVLLFKTFASGTQIYTCAARTDDPNAFAWTFKAPDAELWNDASEKLGTHYAGPTWEGNDGSSVVAEVASRADAPNPGAIPWLLLKAKSTSGAGVFTNMTYIQRLETVGGVAPAEGCDQSTVGMERAVGYAATYAFYYGAAR
jgi:hypothetical protein